jgi:RNA polymerase sigma-70 factor, ECF subfamily
LESGVHFAVGNGEAQINMQATESYIGSEGHVDAGVLGGTRDMHDVVTRCLRSFYRNAYRHLGNAADAEDAVQDALLSAYKHLDQFKGDAQMSTWLTAIVTNSARMQLRRRPRQAHVSLDEEFGEEQKYSLSERLAHRGPSPEDECRMSELHGRLMQLAEQLSPPLRKAFQLRDVQGLTTSEAAQVLGVAEGTVKAQVARARAKLRRLMSRALRPQRCSSLSWTALPVEATE